MVDDRQGLRQALAVNLQHRNLPLRVARQMFGQAMRARDQIDRDPVIGDPFQRKRDPHR